MKHRYRIYALGPLPDDLKERIVALHATGILKSKSENALIHTRENNSRHKGAPQSIINGKPIQHKKTDTGKD